MPDPSRRSRLVPLLALWIAIGAVPLMAAQDGAAVEPFSVPPRRLLAWPTEQQPAADDLTHTLVWQDAIHFDAEGRREMVFHRIYRLLSPAAVEHGGNVRLQWSPWHQQEPVLKARVITPAGGEFWLDPATISQQNVGAAGESDRRLMQAPLPALEVGAVVEFRMVVRETRPLLPGGGSRAVLRLAGDAPTESVRLEVTAPEGFPVHQRVHEVEGLEPEVIHEGGRVRWVLRRGPMVPEAPVPPLLPPDAPTGQVWVVTTGDSWASTVAAYQALVTTALEGSDPEALAAAPAAGTAAGPGTLVTALMQWMHSRVRLVPLDLGDSPLAPRPPAETLRRGVGESKDLAVLLVALLERAGIPATVALVERGWDRDIDPELPGFGRFNHVLVHLASGQWIDPTARHARPGELPLTLQNRWALIIEPGQQKPVLTPEEPASSNLEREVRDITLAPLGPALVREVSTVRGETEREYRENFSNTSAERMEERLKEYVTGWLNAESLGEWSHSDPGDLSEPFTLRLEAEDSTLGYTDLIEAAAVINLTEVLGDLPDLLSKEPEEDAEPREQDLYLRKPYLAEIVYRVQPPAGYRLRETPRELHETWGPATYQRTVRTEEGGIVEVAVRFDTGARRLSAADAETVRQGVLKIDEEPELRLFFDNIAEAHLAAGELQAALQDLDRRLAESPEDGLLHTRRARVLLEAGLGEVAREESARGVALAPDIALVHIVRGLVLQHDPFGRWLRGAFDYDGTIAAFRRAVELEEDSQYLTNLAVHLEHNATGDHRGAGAHLDEAIEVLRRHRELVGDSQLDSNLLADLFATERWSECLELVDTLPANGQYEAIRLAVLAITEGSEAALRRAALISNGEQRNAVLGATVTLLVERRHYGPAVALVRSLATTAPDAARSLAQLSTLASARRHEEVPVPEDPVEAFMHRVFKTIFLGSQQDMLTLFSPRLGEERLRRELEDQWQGLIDMRRGATAAGGIDFIVDITLGLMDLSQETSAVGTRVHLRGALANQGLESFFLVEDQGGLHLLADADEIHRLGGEALRCLEADPPDLAAARQWLDWARQGLNDHRDADDPLAGNPFARLWREGQEATLEEIRLAAAALAAGGEEHGKPEADAAIPLLQAAWAAVDAPVDQPLPGEAGALAAALLQAYLHGEHWDQALALAGELLEREPLSNTAFEALGRAVNETGQWQILRDAAAVRQEILPGDGFTLRQLAYATVGLRDWDMALGWQRQAVDSDDFVAGDLNQLAWYQLIAGRVSPETVDLAQRAAAGEAEGEAAAALHTLATAYAELGQPREAIQVLRQVLDERGGIDPKSDDWYILGRLAESYGLPEYARSAYERALVDDSPVDRSMGTRVLAERRLAAMTERDALD